MGSLEGKVAIVTGGARGVGQAYCLGLAREGAAVVAADLTPADEVVAQVTSAGGRAASIPVDVSDQASTEALAAETIKRFGRLDILVNNAAHFRYVEKRRFYDIPVDEWDKAFDVNVRGSWLCARAVYPQMQAQHSGRIINISSMVVWRGTPSFLHYLTSKAAIIGLTRGLAVELGADNISVNTVVPDFMPHNLEYAAANPQIDQVNVGDRVFRRTQTPEDMVGTVVFLAGPGADFITGQSIMVNGGSRFQ
jgi:3-oxoacyl-[acyl-carrier protein] reductase